MCARDHVVGVPGAVAVGLGVPVLEAEAVAEAGGRGLAVPVAILISLSLRLELGWWPWAGRRRFGGLRMAHRRQGLADYTHSLIHRFFTLSHIVIPHLNTQ